MKYVNSGSPQIRDNATTKRIMIDVCIALLPATIVGCIFLALQNPQYAIHSAILMVISVLSAVAAEFVYKLVAKVPFQKVLADFDYSSVVTGMLIGMNLYQDSQWYVAVLASVFAIVLVKMIFGGTGKNIVNPAIVGRIFVYISFGAGLSASTGAEGTATTGATPLHKYVFNNANGIDLWNLFLGKDIGGCIGEISKIALLIGGVYLVLRGVINFRWPLVYMLVTGITTVIISVATGTHFVIAIDKFLPSILSGGLMLGAIFMATDYVTSPITKLGKYIYYVFLGVITAILRNAIQAEAVSFAILLGNLVVPLIDNFVVNRPFGWRKQQKEVQ